MQPVTFKICACSGWGARVLTRIPDLELEFWAGLRNLKFNQLYSKFALCAARELNSGQVSSIGARILAIGHRLCQPTPALVGGRAGGSPQSERPSPSRSQEALRKIPGLNQENPGFKSGGPFQFLAPRAGAINWGDPQ